jgi:hypothetical protein
MDTKRNRRMKLNKETLRHVSGGGSAGHPTLGCAGTDVGCGTITCVWPFSNCTYTDNCSGFVFCIQPGP